MLGGLYGTTMMEPFLAKLETLEMLAVELEGRLPSIGLALLTYIWVNPGHHHTHNTDHTWSMNTPPKKSVSCWS